MLETLFAFNRSHLLFYPEIGNANLATHCEPKAVIRLKNASLLWNFY